MRYELKRSDGKVVEWEGRDPIDAATRYVDARRVAGEFATIIASRPADRHGIFVFGRAGTIIE